ncbi:MAG: NAD-dependent succinate-semialdehyde dehydrogenase [Methylotetracoccus sp.]|nr:NAD-dependent succinate-semialdehyde dehydrogenase [Methylotetracoccus sp.]
MPQKIFTTTNPANGELLECYPEFSAPDLERALEAAVAAQRIWRASDFAARADRLRRLAVLLRERQDRYAFRMAREMGKVVPEGRAEIEKCARACDFFTAHGEAMLRPDIIPTEAHRSWVDYLPLGVVFAVMPWNFPFWQVCRSALPALLAGNGFLLKHAPNVFGCASDLEALFCDAGFPEGLVRSLVVDIPQVAGVISDRRIAAVTLTGSVEAGRAVGALAGQALKKCVLELGGSDPFIVLPDADLDRAVSAAVTSRFQNCGQSCIAAKRFILVDAVRAAFLERFIAQVRMLQAGDPCDPDSTMGPLARVDLREKLHAQVERTVAAGARRVCGGLRPVGPGAFYPPTVIDQVPPGSPALEEELFGPVATVVTVPNEAEAVRVANDTSYGLAASVWTSDLERGERVCRAIESGLCFINRAPFSDPRLPFGGIKQSGYGRELSQFGLREFVNVCSVWVDRV